MSLLGLKNTNNQADMIGIQYNLYVDYWYGMSTHTGSNIRNGRELIISSDLGSDLVPT